MTGELLYSVEVAITRCPGEGEGGANPGPTEKPVIVRYCDICRRWGAAGTTHTCWRNWRQRLSDLLIEMTRDGRRP
jgi:hypothetical protein